MKLLILLLLLAAGIYAQTCLYCNKCRASGQCAECTSGFMLNERLACRLFSPITGCVIYMSNSTSTMSRCKNCIVSSIPINGGAACAPMLLNCKSAIDTDSCSECLTGFNLVDKVNCYSSNFAQCPLGSLPVNLSYCIPFPLQNCQTPTDNQQSCVTCMQGLTKINGICLSVSKQVPCPGNSCSCNGYLFNSVCYSVVIDNCLVSENGIFCNICKDGFSLIRGRCLVPVKTDDIFCNIVSDSGRSCIGCNLNYLISPYGYCVRSFKVCPTAVCTTCPPGFLLWNGQCYIQDPFCISFNTVSNTCQACFSGYELKPNQKMCSLKSTCFSKVGELCRQCIVGYQLITNACVRLPPNCLRMNEVSLACAECNANTQLSPNGICIFLNPNCLNYNPYGKCLECVSGFTQIRQECIPIAAHCIQAEEADASRCVRCMSGYVRDPSDRLCYPQQIGCQIYASKSACLFCLPQYYLLEGNCFYQDTNCAEMNVAGQCLRCIDGYYPFRDRCVIFDPFCSSYDANGVSSGAFAAGGAFSTAAMTAQQTTTYRRFMAFATKLSMEGSGGSAAGAISISGKADSFTQGVSASQFSYNSTTRTYSLGGGSMTSKGIIMTLPFAGISSSSIVSYNSRGAIISCRTGFTLNSGLCVRLDSQCNHYTLMGGCHICRKGYELNSQGRCVQLSSDSCLNLQIEGCSQCRLGYSLIEGGCYAFGAGVVRTDQTTMMITEVATGYYIWRSVNAARPFDANCVQQNAPGQCIQCASMFSNINGVCTMSFVNVNSYNQYGLPSGCASGSLSFGTSCIISSCRTAANATTGLCDECATGLVLYLGLCVNMREDNCLIYARQGGCRNCVSHFYLDNSARCVAIGVENCQTVEGSTGRCTQCYYGYTLSYEACVTAVASCSFYNEDGTCGRCQSGFFLMNARQCVQLPNRCRTLNAQRQCSACNSPYTPIVQNSESICAFPVPDCKTFNNAGNCITCNPLYVLQNNLCRFFINGCLEVDTVMKVCLTCLSGFTRTADGFCLGDVNCFRQSQGVCLECNPGFYLNSDLCTAIPYPGCAKLTSDMKCVSCLADYQMIGQACFSSREAYNGCQQRYHPCQGCQPGFTLRPDGFCMAINCLLQNSLRQCTSCLPYFVLDSSRRFCQLFQCTGADCFSTRPNPPTGFTYMISPTTGIERLAVFYCQNYNGIRCTNCSMNRSPVPNTPFGLCYPNFCRASNTWNCQNNCMTGFYNVPNALGICAASFCEIYNYAGGCTRCQTGYTLVGQACHDLGPCEVINSITGMCQVCRSYYTLSNGACRPANCDSFGQNSKCLICKIGYLANSEGLCMIARCDLFERNYCIRCVLGYQIRIDLSICEPMNCLNYGLTLSCDTCSEGYQVTAEGGCVAKFCQTYSASYVCQSCQNRYSLVSLSGSNAPACAPSNCRTYRGLACVSCNDGYYLNVTGGYCYTSRDVCKSSNANNECIECVDQTYTLINGVCYLTIPKCARYSGSKCVACQSGRELDSNGQCQPKFCNTLTTFQNVIYCRKCNPGFRLVIGYICLPFHCKSFNQGTWECLECDLRSQLLPQGFCFTRNCQNRDESYNCTQCMTGFTAVNNVCGFNYCETPFSATCQSCIDGFKLNVEGICVIDQSLCSGVSQGLCTGCISGFALTSYGGCSITLCVQPLADNTCAACRPEFVAVDNNRICVHSFCQYYNGVTSGCVTCLKGTTYNRITKECVDNNCLDYISPTCNRCVANMTPLKNHCLYTGCQLFYFGEQTCRNCGYGYSFTNSRCTPLSCTTVDPSNTLACQTCATGYARHSAGYCQASNCLRFKADIPGCVSCFDFFETSGDICLAANCLAYNSVNVCTSCRVGFRLAEDSTCRRLFCVRETTTACQQCPNGFAINDVGMCVPLNCLRYASLSNPVCNQCAIGFVLEDYGCIPDNCFTFSDAYICTACRDGFTLTQSSGVSLCVRTQNQCQLGQYYDGSACTAINKVLNCAYLFSSNLNACLMCNAGYFLWGGKCWTFSNCVRYSSIQGCYSCIDGYVLRNRQCVRNTCKVPIAADGTCSQCITSYLPRNGWCEDFSLNCQIPLVTGCSLCQTGYSLQNKFCFLNPVGCTTATSPQACLVCSSGYLLQNNVCWAVIPFCATQVQSTCSTCQRGYEMTSDYKCRRPAGQYKCLTYDGSNKCLTCQSGFELKTGNICIATGCLSYHSDLFYCLTCKSQYRLVGDNCVLYSFPNCAIPLSDVACSICNQGFENYLGTCYPRVANCATYNSLGCLTCLPSYTLTINTCISNIQNCITSDATGCLSCVVGYTPAGGACPRIVASCSQYSASGCSGCMAEFTLFSGSCVRIVANCGRYTSLGCAECAAGYSMYERLCYRTVSNCDTYFNNACSKCLTEYTLFNSACYLTVNNCVNYANSGCLRCGDEFSLQANACHLSVSRCAEYSSNVCSRCEAGFTLQNRVCYFAIDQCNSYSDSGCTACNSGFFLQGGRCYRFTAHCVLYNSVGCQDCASGYRLQGGVCYAFIQNCQTYSAQGCQTCNSGFSLSASMSTCVATEANCAQYNNEACSLCVAPFVLVGGRCYSAISNCVRYGAAGACLQCLSLFTLQNNVCYSNIASCSRYVEGAVISTCQACQLGFLLEGNSCNDYSQNCQTLDTANNRGCVTCKSGFYLASGRCRANPTGCRRANSAAFCSECEVGYLMSNNVCYEAITHCARQEGPSCLQCQKGYDPISGVCRKPRIYKCRVYTDAGACSTCESSFILRDNKCVSVGCIEFHPELSYCTACDQTYQLAGESCQSYQLPNCNQALDATNCRVCADGYILQLGVCYRELFKCLTYSSSGCTVCSSGFQVYQGVCVETDINCLQYGPSGCVQCKNYYQVVFGICVASVADCTEYSRLGCVRCGTRYTLQENFCFSNIQNCRVYSSNGNCKTCADGWTVGGSICVGIVDNCQTYNEQGCSSCIPGFMYDSALRNCFRAIPNCQIYAGRLCKTCINGYVSLQTSCVPAIPHCTTYTANGCQACADGFILAGNGPACYAKLPNCKVLQSPLVCQQCDTNFMLVGGRCPQCLPGFSLLNGKCVTNNDPFCITLASENLCQTCVNGFSVNEIGRCSPSVIGCARIAANGQCVQCQSNYILMQGQCNLRILNCVMYHKIFQYCTACQFGYVLRNNNCVQVSQDNCRAVDRVSGLCQTCNAEFAIVAGGCVKTIANCANYFGQKCIQCMRGFILYNGNCLPQIPNCLQYNINYSQCTKCRAGLLLRDFKCEDSVSVANCISFNETNNQCTQCAIQYLLRTNRCNAYPGYCSNVDEANKCLSCVPGASISATTNVCSISNSAKLNCLKFNLDSNTCQQCNSGYQYCPLASACLKMDPNCKTFSSDSTVCVACKYGFFLYNGTCLSPTVGQNFLAAVTACNTGYTLVEKGCYRNKEDLVSASDVAGVTYIYSSAAPSSGVPKPGTSRTWEPTAGQNEYIGYKSTVGPLVIFRVDLAGSSFSNSWVTSYILQYRQIGKPFLCWNSCTPVTGSVDINSVNTLKLLQPIVAEQVRLYPIQWQNAIGLRMEMWVQILPPPPTSK